MISHNIRSYCTMTQHQELLHYDTLSIPEDEPNPHWLTNLFFNGCKFGIYEKKEGNPLCSVFVLYVISI
jgi:hypothetical protein